MLWNGCDSDYSLLMEMSQPLSGVSGPVLQFATTAALSLSLVTPVVHSQVKELGVGLARVMMTDLAAVSRLQRKPQHGQQVVL